MQALKKWLAGRHASVEISERDGVRCLHLGGDAIQSAIRLDAPDALELHYTRAMMGFLLFQPEPRDILMIGLGGGSIARFVHRRLESARMTVIELNPRVVAVARAHFGLPVDDERLQVLIEDGAEYVPAHEQSADALLLDAFDDGEAVAPLCSQRFYDSCYAALRDGGVFAQNLMADDSRLNAYIGRIERAFEGRVLCLPSGDRVNMIVFGLRCDARRLPVEALRKLGAKLHRRLGLPYASFVRDLLAHNLRTVPYLKLEALS